MTRDTPDLDDDVWERGSRMDDMHDWDELTELHALEIEAERDAQNATDRCRRIRDLIAQREAQLIGKPPQQRNLRALVLIPAGIGSAAASLKAWHMAHPAASTAISTGAASAVTAGIISLAVLGEPHSQQHEHPDPPAAVALPPTGHRPHHIAPPKSTPPAPARARHPVTESASKPPSGSGSDVTVALRPDLPPVPHVSVSLSPVPKLPPLPTTSPTAGTQDCRINLPRLRIRLLCGQPLQR